MTLKSDIVVSFLFISCFLDTGLKKLHPQTRVGANKKDSTNSLLS